MPTSDDMPLAGRRALSSAPRAKLRRARAGNANADPMLLRLHLAAVRFADAFEATVPSPTDVEAYDRYCRRFIRADDEHREASLAYARSLSKGVRLLMGE